MELKDNSSDRPRPVDPDIEKNDPEETEPSEEGGGSVRIDPPDTGGEPYTDP